MTFFRIQTASYAPEDLLIADNQHSSSWGGPESYDRDGVSACRSREELAAYLAHSGIPFGIGEWIVVEMEADVIDGADPIDAEFGEVLVTPTAIVSVGQLDDGMLDMIDAEFDRA